MRSGYLVSPGAIFLCQISSPAVSSGQDFHSLPAPLARGHHAPSDLQPVFISVAKGAAWDFVF
jgi:hypothetical protein